MKIECAAVHGAAAALRRIETGAKPFEVGSVSPIHGDFQKARRRQLQRMLRLTLDGLRQFLRSHLPKRQVNGRQMLSIQRVKLRIVSGAVFRTVPPAPIASLRGQEGFHALPSTRFLSARRRGLA